MSSDESDWSDDEEEVGDTGEGSSMGLPPPPPRPPSPDYQGALVEVHSSDEDNDESEDEVAEETIPPQQMFLGLPTKLYNVDKDPECQRGIVTGIVLLYNSTEKVFTVMVYDNNKRPIILDPIDGTLESSKKRLKAPLDFQIDEKDGRFATATDRMKRNWKFEFCDHLQSARVLAYLCLAAHCIRSRTTSHIANTYVYCDVKKGEGNKCKSKHYAVGSLRVWNLCVNQRTRPVCTIAEPHSPDFLQFCPNFEGLGGHDLGTGGFYLPICDIKVSSVKDDGYVNTGPKSLNQMFAKMRVGGQRLLVIPRATASSDRKDEESELKSNDEFCSAIDQEILEIAQDYEDNETLSLEAIQALQTGNRASNVLVILLTVDAMNKKRVKKKKKSKSKECKKTAANADDAGNVHGTDESTEESKQVADDSIINDESSNKNNDDTASSPSANDVKTSIHTATASSFHSESEAGRLSNGGAPIESVPSDEVDASEILSKSVEEVDTSEIFNKSMEEVDQSVGALAPTQLKILKRVLQKMYNQVVENIDRKTEENDEDQDQGRQAEEVKAVLADAMKQAVDQFADFNHKPVTGTLISIRESFDKLTSSFNVMQERNQSTANSQEIAQFEQKIVGISEERDSLKKKLHKKEKEFRKLGDKQATLAMSMIETESQLEQLQSENKTLRAEVKKAKDESQELNSKLAMLEVFEQGIKDMREMLEREAKEKNRLEHALEDLTRFQSKLKLTWLPQKAVKHCMSCRSGFSMWGSKSKTWCRYCGRVFCRACCIETPLPEFGFPNRVRCCNSCADFRTQVENGEA